MRPTRFYRKYSPYRLRAIGLPIVILMVLTSCTSPKNTDWSTVLPTATGGGVLPYLLGVAINAALRPELEPVSGESSAWPDICTQIRDGNGAARASIGQHYRFGWEPISRDPIEAYKWFTLASDSGYVDADQIRATMAEEMTPEQIAEGERLATVWSADAEACEFESETETAADSPAD